MHYNRPLAKLDRQLSQLMQRDSNYFKQHPTAEYYIRTLDPIEHQEAQALGKSIAPNSKMLVYQIAPATRLRQSFAEHQLNQVLAIARKAKTELANLPAAKSKKQVKRTAIKGFQPAR